MIQPNISPSLRGFYALSGIALVVFSFAADVQGWMRWVIVAVGLMALLEGAIGW